MTDTGTDEQPEVYDAAVLGGGAAGLNAAMLLGRQRRSVLLADDGRPRNAPAREMHMFLSRDGFDPAELRRLGRQELAAYPSITTVPVRAESASGVSGDFTLTFSDGTMRRARRLLLATGLRDHLPAIPGLMERFGRTVFHCPFCHGWESRDTALAVIGTGKFGPVQAAYIADRFSTDVHVLTNGPFEAGADVRSALEALGARIDETPLEAIEGEDEVLIRFADGRMLDRDGVFAFPTTTAGSTIGADLGAESLLDGCLAVDAFGRTTVPGVYAAGDAGRSRDLPGPASSVIGSAGSGAQTAMWLEQDLFRSSGAVPLP